MTHTHTHTHKRMTHTHTYIYKYKCINKWNPHSSTDKGPMNLLFVRHHKYFLTAQSLVLSKCFNLFLPTIVFKWSYNSSLSTQTTYISINYIMSHQHTHILKNYYKAPKCGKYQMRSVRRGRLQGFTDQTHLFQLMFVRSRPSLNRWTNALSARTSRDQPVLNAFQPIRAETIQCPPGHIHHEHSFIHTKRFTKLNVYWYMYTCIEIGRRFLRSSEINWKKDLKN